MRNFLLMIGLCLSQIGMAQVLPYQNPNLSAEERAEDLISRLTLEEKAILMCDISEAIPRLGIKPFNWWSEALHGAANYEGVTVFPEPVGMAASFNDVLLQNIFDKVSDEMRALYNIRGERGEDNVRFHSLSVWTPNVNIFRDPRWGRGQETYGEDPYLTSRMGLSVVRGLQGNHPKYLKLSACAKHYAVHSGPEWSRHTANLTDVAPRDLWETYMPAFKTLVQDGEVRQVMCAYQRLDDDPCCGSSRLLQQILRDEWGFKHLVVSDCGAVTDFYQNHKSSSDAVHAAAKGTLAGTDVECGFGYAYNEVPEAVRRGFISEEEVNKHVRRIIIERIALGEMDDDNLVPWTKIPASVISSKEHANLSLQMARESMTLLKNENNILPLKKGKKIAVIGPNADNERMMWGNYNGKPLHTVTILQGIIAKNGKKNVVYLPGCDITDEMMLDNRLPECSIDGKKGIKATYYNNPNQEGTPVISEWYTDHIQLATTGQHQFAQGVNLKEFSGRYETTLVPTESGEYCMKSTVWGEAVVTINGKVYMTNDHWWQTLSSRIAFPVEKGKEYNIRIDFKQEHLDQEASFDFQLGREHETDFSKLANQLKGIETVVFVGGLTPNLEGEEMPVSLPGFRDGDRTDIELPVSQRKCIDALRKAGKKIIFVNCSGSAVALVPEVEASQAMLQAWYSGQEGGTAVADVLYGDYNPSGKLPITFYKSMSQLPDFEDYSMVGRTYRYMTQEPLFAFGYGLSYTNFNVGEAKVSSNAVKVGDEVTLTIPVSNTGKRKGTEIVQVYIKNNADKEGPVRSLKAFQRVELTPGATANVKVVLSASAFECWDAASNTMRVQAGDYTVFYGQSSRSQDLKSVNVKLND